MSELSGILEESVAGTFYLETYGCQMNVADSELITGVLSRDGYRSVAAPEDADVILLNTCAIREHAEQRVGQRVRQLIALRRENRRVRVGLAGCMAQHHREHLLDTIPGLDFIVGPDGYRRLPELLRADAPTADVRLDRKETYEDIAPIRGEGVRAWVTIMRGCNRFCTFCVVPYVRGREKSVPSRIVVDEVRSVAAQGFKEVVLLGQTVNAYRDGTVDFGDLLRLCAEVDGIERVRFTSPHPADMTESAIGAMRDLSEVCPYLHLPVQSGSDRMLAAMDRGHTVDDYRRLVDRLRAAVPDIALSTDVIVGYPGETTEDFGATARLMAEIDYDHAFLFKYSPREGTRAFRIPDTVTEQDKSMRLQRLIEEQEDRSARIHRGLVGSITPVLVESTARRQAGWLAGKSPHFRTVVFEPSGARIGQTVAVRIESASSHTLRGRQVAA